MALLPPAYLDAVVALGVGDDATKRRWVGTGFLYGMHEPRARTRHKRYVVFLITNKHVLGDHGAMWVKFNDAARATSRDEKVALRARNGREVWIGHPDPDVDLAAIFVNAATLKAKRMRARWFHSDEHVFTLRDLASEQVTEGDGAFVLGYPMGMVDAAWQSAICRRGCIARIRDVIAAGTGDFLIDAPVFPGNSGGPVVLEPNPFAVPGTRATTKANLIGVVQSYLPYQDVAVSVQTGMPRVTFSENSGLASVIPVDRVDELMAVARKRVRNRLGEVRYEYTG